VETIARVLITTGGAGTIVAVGAICVFLAWVVAPLFRPPSLEAAREVATSAAAEPVLHAGIDEHRTIAWSVDAAGTLDVVRLETGERLEQRALFGGERPTCSSLDREHASLAFGFASGDLRFASLSLTASHLGEGDVPGELRALAPGQRAAHGGRVVERTADGEWRSIALECSVGEPVRVSRSEPPAAVRLVDHTELSSGELSCALTSDGELVIASVRRSTNLLTGEESLAVSGGELAYRPPPSGEWPAYLRVFGSGEAVLVAWRDGRAVRFDSRALDAAREAEVVDLVPQADAELTALEFLIGKRTLLAGDSEGGVGGWFLVKPRDASTCDGSLLLRARDFSAPDGRAVSAIAASASSRSFAVAREAGGIELVFATNARALGSTRVPGDAPIRALAIAPRDDALVAWTQRGIACSRIDAPHPETSAAALAAPIWYENYVAPAHVWQSSSGTDDFERKLGLVPLVVGTLKATLYSMLFGAPLALLAAIFTSEFLGRHARTAVKSTIEIMASLPSVVLGFLAAIVIAPFVQGVVPEVLTALFTIPVALLAGAHAWQLVPQRLTLRFEGWRRLALIAGAIPLGVGAAILLGRPIEWALFGGDIARWLDGGPGGALGGWLLALIPVSALAVALAIPRWVDPWLRSVSLRWSRARCARAALAKLAAAVLATLALGLAASAALAWLGFDARGAWFGTYVQRNALVVGFVMGFAIIPIVYTLAEDALASVPGELRLASLGSGATPWQTAVRVIVPTAMSGLFSAVMIGLGRAVGETMIVLMAAGNTPVMDWNVFSGFRTLSANIAVELPEAVRNDTHYRTLFLAALALFLMTFAVNTLAELVRQRFRKRAFQL
jgi:phosphate transport system permease protein